ncbi:MAG: SDR family NAD(P)-dependent oxidoreductase [Promethearchaeota archaeon]|nr:MAG: SDR family NAD(P)-dependent oxidoreductase [Candidatus Lokiarchaeota archaeon]
MANEDLMAQKPFKDKFALIPGGSKGMGKAVAKLFIQLGGSVCIIARGMDALKETQEECEKLKPEESQYVEIISCDTQDMDKLKPLVEEIIKKHKLPDFLFNFVGYAYADYLEKLTLDDFKNNMNVNYYGQLVPTLIILPHFMDAKQGYITFTSSVMGFMAIMGYATYVPSKYAVFGLAEVLRHELLPYNIQVSVLFPVDTDTPGLAEENKLKPEECKIISESGGLMSADEVAEIFIRGVLEQRFEILPGEAAIQLKSMRENPDDIRGVTDALYKRARRKTKKKI